jgi:histidinol phosphatase-like PHP family hydrolase
MGMIDFHTHSFLSDGELAPSELARRAEARGYRAIGIADHVDGSNADLVIPRLVSVCRELSAVMDIVVVAGVEITHVPPLLMASMVKRCRELGAEYLIVHGETVVEPVKEGTNAAALKTDIDILAHPGMVTPAEAREAAANGILLEISSRKGNCLANGRVVRVALETGAGLVVGSDAHDPADLITQEEAVLVAKGAGLGEDDVEKTLQNAEQLLNTIIARRK